VYVYAGKKKPREEESDSGMVLDVLKGLLHLVPTKRINFQEALESPLFVERMTASERFAAVRRVMQSFRTQKIDLRRASSTASTASAASDSTVSPRMAIDGEDDNDADENDGMLIDDGVQSEQTREAIERDEYLFSIVQERFNRSGTSTPAAPANGGGGSSGSGRSAPSEMPTRSLSGVDSTPVSSSSSSTATGARRSASSGSGTGSGGSGGGGMDRDRGHARDYDYDSRKRTRDQENDYSPRDRDRDRDRDWDRDRDRDRDDYARLQQRPRPPGYY
jgi:hypothetical protein